MKYAIHCFEETIFFPFFCTECTNILRHLSYDADRPLPETPEHIVATDNIVHR